ncbi:actin-related protein 8-like [Dendronephthya gigantea]|uniref:actin-related protein 8-like n=1 Tax=Dendronephthya gigantea TaxID=151771 RepID=UPI0010698350|nr:actin-related protein 8-like [Dendronephthya gigantea]
MPRGVKAEISEPMESTETYQPVNATTIIVLHPGSTTLWLGRATDHAPQSMPHVVAWKRPTTSTLPKKPDSLFSRPGLHQKESETQKELALSIVEQGILTKKANKRHQQLQEQVASFNAESEADELDEVSHNQWTDTSNYPSYIVGEQAMYINDNDPYTLHWPMKGGSLNLHSDVGGSLTSVCADLEAIWAHGIEKYLNIPKASLQFHRAVLVVPNTFNKQYVKEMLNILLCKLGFSSAIIQLESVSSSFGCGISCGCVVDVGHEKTHISCVDDGLTIPASRLILQYGGNDITRCFFWLLKKMNFPYKECDPYNNKLDVYLLKELKETFCHLNQEIPAGQIHEFQVHRPGVKPLLYELKLGDEVMQAPMAMFYPQLFGIVGEILVKKPSLQYDDPEDLFDDKQLLESGTREPKAGKSDQTMTETDEMSKPSGPSMMKKTTDSINPEKGLGLDNAIIHSIASCGSEETQQKLFNNILLIGGGFMFNGALAKLQERLKAKLLNRKQSKLADSVEVMAKSRDVDARTICWKGAAILGILDSAQELWITQAEWTSIGIRVLRERSLFVWSPDR